MYKSKAVGLPAQMRTGLWVRPERLQQGDCSVASLMRLRKGDKRSNGNACETGSAVGKEKKNSQIAFTDLSVSRVTNCSICIKVPNSVCQQHAVQSCQTFLWCPSRFCPGPVLFTLFTALMASIVNRQNFNHHFYADDTQLLNNAYPKPSTLF